MDENEERALMAEAKAMTDLQLQVRIECEKELMGWREGQIARLQAELLRSRFRLMLAGVELYSRAENAQAKGGHAV